jgi:hypothetical protein
MNRLAALNGWRLMLLLVALAIAIELGIWALLWVAWVIRPLLAVTAALGGVAWALYARRRYRLQVNWHAEEWIGS